MLRIPEDALVVVADGARARLFRQRGTSMEPRLEEVRDLVPGGLDYEGPSGHVATGGTPRENDEATFSKMLAQELYRDAHANAYRHLVLIADPDSLGEIRASLHKEVRERVLLELAKEMTRASVAEIESALKNVLDNQA